MGGLDRRAARVLRFLNTEESTRELAKLYFGAAQLLARPGQARAITIDTLLSSGERSLGNKLRPALIAAWSDLPPRTQDSLLHGRRNLAAGLEMLPILNLALGARLQPNTRWSGSYETPSSIISTNSMPMPGAKPSSEA